MAVVSREIAFSRLLRPFSTKRLSDALYHVQATGHGIDQRLMRLLINPPATPELWEFELDQIAGELWSLADYCEKAQARVRLLARSASRDYEVAVDAMTATLKGLAESEAA